MQPSMVETAPFGRLAAHSPILGVRILTLTRTKQLAQRIGERPIRRTSAVSMFGHKLRVESGGRLSTSTQVTSHRSPAGHEHPGVTDRCIIPLRVHPFKRNRMPRPGLPRRERDHHSRILPALLKRPRQCLQPEIQPRTRHEPRRSGHPASAAFSGRAIPRPLRQCRGQPRHQIRTPPPGDL